MTQVHANTSQKLNSGYENLSLTLSQGKTSLNYGRVFTDFNMPLWQRIVGGAALPLAPFFLMMGCDNEPLHSVPQRNIDVGFDPVQPEGDIPADMGDTVELPNPTETPTGNCESGDALLCGPCELGVMICSGEEIWGECGITSPYMDSCYTGPEGTQEVGECHDGAAECSFDAEEEAWSLGTCVGEMTPQEEICDNRDNDCDGLTDESLEGGPLQLEFYTGPEGTMGRGSCVAGAMMCVAGGELTIIRDEVLPHPEICDGIDNDCNGEVDDRDCEGEVVCTVTDSFEFGDDTSSHYYEQSSGVHPGNGVDHSCGASLGVYFSSSTDWVQVSLAVDPLSEFVRVNTMSDNWGASVLLDGFECYFSNCFTGYGCEVETNTWRAEQWTEASNRFEGGLVDISINSDRTDSYIGTASGIASVEIESCVRIIP